MGSKGFSLFPSPHSLVGSDGFLPKSIVPTVTNLAILGESRDRDRSSPSWASHGTYAHTPVGVSCHPGESRTLPRQRRCPLYYAHVFACTFAFHRWSCERDLNMLSSDIRRKMPKIVDYVGFDEITPYKLN